mmetsp:Transcript_16822/g.43295  ORF Transcript_16822/g.43295 Transcript_16822/m.43295 type:complete len:173 (+) Transcript_16822:699-1217(+)
MFFSTLRRMHQNYRPPEEFHTRDWTELDLEGVARRLRLRIADGSPSRPVEDLWRKLQDQLWNEDHRRQVAEQYDALRADPGEGLTKFADRLRALAFKMALKRHDGLVGYFSNVKAARDFFEHPPKTGGASGGGAPTPGRRRWPPGGSMYQLNAAGSRITRWLASSVATRTTR